MKLSKLFIFALLMCLSANSFAADIVIKQVKIKKRGISSKTACDIFPPGFDEQILSYMLISTEANALPGYNKIIWEFAANTYDVVKLSGASIDVAFTDCKGNITTKMFDCKLNAKGFYEATYLQPIIKDCEQALTATDITLRTGECSETFETKLNSAKDACNAKYKLKEVNYSTEEAGGFYTVKFDFAFEKDEFPYGVDMLLQFKDTKGNYATLPPRVSYFAAKGIALGSGGLAQLKENPWTHGA